MNMIIQNKYIIYGGSAQVLVFLNYLLCTITAVIIYVIYRSSIQMIREKDSQ